MLLTRRNCLSLTSLKKFCVFVCTRSLPSGAQRRFSRAAFPFPTHERYYSLAACILFNLSYAVSGWKIVFALVVIAACQGRANIWSGKNKASVRERAKSFCAAFFSPFAWVRAWGMHVCNCSLLSNQIYNIDFKKVYFLRNVLCMKKYHSWVLTNFYARSFLYIVIVLNVLVVKNKIF